MAKRKVGLLVMLLAFVTALTIGVVGCTGDGGEGNNSANNSSNNAGYDFNGEYYTEIDGVTYTLSFNDKMYSMTLGNLSGAFEYDGTTLTLKGNNSLSAQMNNQAITVTYNGKTYRFLKKVNYTVTFETNGGSNVPNATVLNGKTVSKPADPEKTDCEFIGWYADAGFKAPFLFGTAITADTKLYARFAEKSSGATEFTATFSDSAGGNYEPQTTVGGKLYNLPTPTDSTFAGWYVSDTDNANKLTYKYEEQTLYQNVTLYAVYGDGTPQPSVTDAGIKWSPAGAGAEYALTVVGPDGASYGPYNMSSNEYKFNFSDKPEGEYAVTLTVKGVKKTAYYTNKGLAKVSVFTAEDNLFRYNAVPNAEKYYITVECGNENHNHTAYDNGTSLYYDFSGCSMKEGGIKFTVTAVAEGYVSSTSDAYYFDRSLAAVTGFKVENDTATWNAVEGAEGYTVEITQGNSLITKNVGNETSYSLKFYTGNMTVKVYANKADYNSSSSDAVAYNKTTLAAPAGLTMNGSTMSWNKVDGATGYEVTVNGNKFAATTNSFDFTANNVASASEYNVTVTAKASTAANDSQASDAMTVHAADTKDVIAYADGYVTWNYTMGAQYHEVKVNNQEAVKVTGTNKYEVPFNGAGEYTVSVRHNYGSMKYTAWVSITVTVYAVEFDVKGGDNIPTKYMAAGDKFDTKEPTMLGYDFAGWYTVPGGASVNGKEYTDTTFNAASDMTLYAYYTPKTYTVTLDTTAGTGETTAKVTYKNDYVLPVPTANDAANGFVGWYTEPNGNGLKYTNELGESLDVWQNVVEIKLYAYWTAYFEFLPVSNGTAWSVMGTAGMKNATYIKVPASYQGKPVVTVDGGAFLNCVKLEKVEIPNTVTLIEVDTAFSNCQKLEEVVIYDAKAEYPDDVAVQNAERGDYTSVDGVLFHPGENDPAPEIVFFPRGKEGRYVIPDGTAVISANVFTQAKITEVVIPSSVTQIQTNAFYYSKLTKVTFVSGNDDVPLTISARAFSSCEGLTTITFPKRLASFDSTLFKYCTALEAVNIDGVGENYCSIDGVVMNADATEILYVPVAFKGVDGVYEVPMSVTKIGGGQVGNVDGDSKNGGAFAGCKAIKTVVFHGNVTEIGENAFRLCYVQEVVFEGNTKDGVTLAIKEGAFSMSRLTAVTLPNYLTEVGENAFYGCSRLKEVTIATTGNVTIAAGSFLSNSGNSNIETVNIGKDVPELELTGIFGTRVVNVNIDPANTNYTEIEGVIYNPQITTLLYYPLGKTGNFTFPATLNKIGNNVFQYKSNLTEINIPKTITEIGAYAFQGCENLATVTFDNDRTEALTIGAYAFANIPAETIAIPDMTTEIGNGAFSNSAFYTISIPASVAKMGAYDDNGVLTAMSVFTGCNNLYSITIAADNANFYTDAAGVVYLKDNGEAKELIYAVKGAVPEGVTTATEVTIPATVTKIWDSIFENNNKVTKVVFTNTATITLGKNVFSHASALKEVTLSTGFTSIPNNMFIECSSLESIDIPYTVTSIGAGAFKNCVSLETVTFSGNRMNEAGTAAAYPLTIADAGGTSSSGKYGYSAAGVFVGCLKLKNLVLPEGTTTIGSSAFMTEEKALDAYFADPNTTDLGLESIYIPSTVTTIGAQAFAGIPVEQAASKSRNINADAYFNNVISGLKTVTFADGCKITQIPNGAFAFTNITSIRIPAKVTTFAASAFHGTPNLKTMTFEEGAVLNTLQSDSVASSGLTSVTLPATVKQLVMRAFKFCYDLETVNFEVNATTGNSALANVSGRTPAPAVGNYVFAYSGLTSISFPKAANPYSLGTNLFEGCKNLTEVTLSESVTNIDNTFAGNISVQKINVAEGSSFAMEGFEDEVNHTYSYVLMFGNNNTSISLVLGKLPETFTVPEGITTIGVRAFGGHSEMKHLVIPAAVTTIGSYGFTECEGLESVTFTGAQDGGAGASQLINLGTYAFYG